MDNDVFYEELKVMDRNCEGEIATVLFKDSTLSSLTLIGNYWIYHKNTIEDANEEKSNPSEKLWLIVKYINPNLNFSTRVKIY